MATKRVLVLFGAFYYHETHRGIAEYAQTQGWHLNPSMSTVPALGTWQGDGITHILNFVSCIEILAYKLICPVCFPSTTRTGY